MSISHTLLRSSFLSLVLFGIAGLAACTSAGEDNSASSEGAAVAAAAQPEEPKVASLCDGAGETVVFSCETTGKKTLSICAYKGAVQYRYGTAKKVENALPKKMDRIVSSEVAEAGQYSFGGPGAPGVQYATFHAGDYDYVVYSADVTKGLDDEGFPIRENTSGVLVVNKGNRAGFMKCAAQPELDYQSFDLLPKSSGTILSDLDVTNPMGK